MKLPRLHEVFGLDEKGVKKEKKPAEMGKDELLELERRILGLAQANLNVQKRFELIVKYLKKIEPMLKVPADFEFDDQVVKSQIEKVKQTAEKHIDTSEEVATEIKKLVHLIKQGMTNPVKPKPPPPPPPHKPLTHDDLFGDIDFSDVK